MSELVKQGPHGPPVVFQPPQQNIWVDAYLDEKENEIAKYFRIVLKRKWLILGVALVVFTGAAIKTLTTTRMYTSTVKLQIDPEQRVLPYQEIYDAVTADPRYLGTQAQVLRSEELGRRIVSKLGLAPNPDQATRMAIWFNGNVQVTPVEGTQVMGVSYDSDDPVFAAKAINTLADEYVNYTFETKHDATTKARDFLEQELAKLQKKMQTSEEQLVEYGREHSILLPSEGDNVIMRKLTDLNQEMTKVETEVLSNQYQSLKDTSLDAFPEKLKTGVMNNLDAKRSELEQRLATATLQFGPKWPEVLTLNEQLSEVRQQLATEKRKALDQAKLEYNLAVAHRSRLAGALADQGKLADQLTQDSIRFNIIKREVETDRQLHENLLQRLKETDVSAGLKSANVHVIDRGQVPLKPSSPNIPLNLATGLMLGLMVGVAFAVSMDFMDRTLKTPEDIERELHIPFLGAIPAFEKSWKEGSGGILMPLTARAVEISGRYLNSAADIYWESYRSLRTSLMFSSPEGRPHSILVTSAVPGEGKSTTAVNLAIALAQTGARTLILELDMRRPRLAGMFQIARTHGMSGYLAGQAELNAEIQQTGVPNLFVVPAGPIPPNPPELIGSARMKTALDLLGRYFEYVVIDGPPLMPVTDALVISRQVSGVVLVVEAGKTPKLAVQKARNLLKSVDANILGAVVNNVAMDDSESYYPGTYSSAQETYLARSDAAGLQ